MEAPIEFWLPDPPETERLGRILAAALRPGDAVLLEGPLGAGKSTLARALLRAACRNGRMEVPSPSFTLVQLYDVLGQAVLTATVRQGRLDVSILPTGVYSLVFELNGETVHKRLVRPVA